MNYRTDFETGLTTVHTSEGTLVGYLGTDLSTLLTQKNITWEEYDNVSIGVSPIMVETPTALETLTYKYDVEYCIDLIEAQKPTYNE